MTVSQSHSLNAICPYFTMFPLDFPLGILKCRAKPTDVVVDPFSGRGTTAYAARLLGLAAVGVDSNPVAAALTRAKLANVTPDLIIREAKRILKPRVDPNDVPAGEFWALAYHPRVLAQLCLLRRATAESATNQVQDALIAVILGALHGPLAKERHGYLSNQSPRTYAPKPAYAVKYWAARDLRPPDVDVLRVIADRARRFYADQPRARGMAILGDSRNDETFAHVRRRATWIITSPPYYGMRTYGPDQWLRSWFLGGPDAVDYKATDQVSHASPQHFVGDLRSVWSNTAEIAKPGARMVIRFGGIHDRPVDPRALIVDSLSGTAWRIETIVAAGDAKAGRRQSDTFLKRRADPHVEHDLWARLGRSGTALRTISTTPR